MNIGPKYYKILPTEFGGYKIKVWRWWWPFWVDNEFCAIYRSEEKAAEWFRCDGVYYDGAE